jgi:hypothetical protein
MIQSKRESRSRTLRALQRAMERSGDADRLVLTLDTRDDFEPQDVLDLRFAATDAEQLASASPKVAEQALVKSARLRDLANGIERLLEKGQ